MQNSPLRIDQIKNILTRLYNKEGAERIGFIVGSEVIEVANIAQNPTEGWYISPEDVLKYGEAAWATWHTHPNHTANLGGDDHVTFKQWPELKHFVLGNDGVKCYQYDETKKAVMEHA